MNETARQISVVLDSVAGAVAEWTVSCQEAEDPSLADRYGPGWRQGWVADTRIRIQLLSQAIAVRQPGLFVDGVAWSRAAHEARGISPEDLDANLRSLRQVLEAEVPEPVRSAALDIVGVAIEDGGTASYEDGAAIGADDRFGREVLRYLEAVVAGNRREAEKIVLDLFESGTSVQDIYSLVLAPAQTEIGLLWHRQEITVAEEHFATRTTEGVMGALRGRFVPAQTRHHAVLTMAIGGNLHGVGVQMVADFFELDGWRSINLGADMPVADLQHALVTHKVDLLGLSASSSMHVRAIGEAIEQVRQQPTEGVKIMVGGYPFNRAPELWRELGADGCAATAMDAVALGNRLVAGRS